MKPTTPLVVAEDIEKSYPLRDRAITALAPTSFEILPDTTTAVVGPSGTGKSTLAAILAGWEQPTGGQLIHPQGLIAVAFVPQRPPLFDTLSVAENITLPDPDQEDQLASIAVRLGVDALLDRFPAEASVGERQRIAIARAIFAQPQLLILDEPSCHQDSFATELLIEAITTPPPGSAIVFTTHDPGLTTLTSNQVVLTKTVHVHK